MFSYLKLLWGEGAREDAMHRIMSLHQEIMATAAAAVPAAAVVDATSSFSPGRGAAAAEDGRPLGVLTAGSTAGGLASSSSNAALGELLTTLGAYETPLLARVSLRLGLWQWTLDSDTQNMQDSTISMVSSPQAPRSRPVASPQERLDASHHVLGPSASMRR